MKKFLGILALCALIAVEGNAAPPKLMLLPSKEWCNSHGYVTKNERNGRTQVRENYDAAFLDSSLSSVEGSFKDLMTSDGINFPVLSYIEAMENSDFDEEFDEMFEGAESGSGAGSSNWEDLLAAKGADPDIYVKVNWWVQPAGIQKSIEYQIDAIDAYSSKSVATIKGMTNRVSNATPDNILLMQGFRDKMDEFIGKLQNHFDDVQSNGREISLRLRMIDNGSGAKFTDEYDGKELATIITDWVSDNTVNHQFTERQSTRNTMSYDQVRVPIFDENNRPQQAKQWVTKLQNYLRSNYGIRAENVSSGLGRGVLMVGEK